MENILSSLPSSKVLIPNLLGMHNKKNFIKAMEMIRKPFSRGQTDSSGPMPAWEENIKTASQDCLAENIRSNPVLLDSGGSLLPRVPSLKAVKQGIKSLLASFRSGQAPILGKEIQA